MLRRLFLVFLPSLTASTSYANDAAWNCEQNKDSKEWVCVGEKKPPAQANAAAPPVKVESAKAVQPALIKPVEQTYPAKVVPPKISKPIKQETAELIQPVSPKPAQVTSPVPGKPVERIQQAKPAVAPIREPLANQFVKSTQPTLPAPEKTAIANSQFSDREVSHAGWNCDASKGDEDWNCQLTGPNPENKTQLAKAEEPLSKFRLLNPAFDLEKEQTFKTLTSQLPYDPWENCNAVRGTKTNFVSESDKRETSPMNVESNYSEIFDNEIGSYYGNVQMTRADQHSSSNKANYDSVSKVLDLHGNVYYSEDALALHSETASLNLAADQSKLRNLEFISPTTPLRGTASALYRESKTLSQYKDVAYTSCRPGNQDWIIHASDLKMNKTTGKGVAKNTWMEFKGAPVFYSPYLSFPIDNRRLSGFLAPSFGTTKYSGFRVAAPYYWNIAPNYDATITPRELSSRGPLLAGNFRYLTEQSTGKVGMEFMPNDSVLNKTRYSGSIKNTSQISDHISSNMDVNYVSDQTYFAELGNALSFSNFNYLRSTADIRYDRPGINLSTRFENYQSINTTTPNAALPYRKLPQVNLNLNHSFQFMPLTTTMENEYIYFQQASLVNGQRINTKPSVSIPLQTSSAYLTPKLSLQHTQYALNNLQPSISSTDSISRTLPIFSADSGLNFERGFTIANAPFLHTLEPRLFYLYVPYSNQQNIPVFDTAQYDFQYNSMFRENSFSGTDRIQDANQITTAITSRLIDDESGLERLKLSVGEIFYFRDRNVTLQYANQAPVVGSSVQTNSVSNLVTELSSELTRTISVTSGLQWNPVINDIERGKAGIHYRNESNEIFNLGYLYRKNPLIPDGTNDITQGDASFRYPIYDNWYAMGRFQYSLLYNQTQDAFFGVEKENCCWRFRIAARHYINNIANTNFNGVTTNQNLTLAGTAQNGVFFEVELKGLSAIGDDMDYFLQQEIYGYRKSQK
ncbi:LPS-assembly protein LptD [Methylobacter sp. S3L5C]|uniref:LPS-assembly protein LptD n=1 Tax=Methylobacter sp. S3L5C TaxID=2839024 RepID=UPI001FAD8F14|nr:LPS assembly protein LptD [Methylobacter sp. S3L5C]UOA08377.1 LPS assembly protein LptD [Methylobacter sp. S3L5C]